MASKEDRNDPTQQQQPAPKLAIKLNLNTKKRTKLAPVSGISDQLQGDEDDERPRSTTTGDDNAPPLVIPVQQNSLPRFSATNEEDEVAARALEQQISTQGGTKKTNKGRVIGAAEDTAHYRSTLAQLPSALDETDNAYQRVPIDDFGAAVLRGMGWKGDDDTTDAKNEQEKEKEEPAQPRPHRLGLGAVPKMPDNNDAPRHRPRRMDEFERDKRRAKQTEMYRSRTLLQQQADPQQTLQKLSIVHIVEGSSRRRARIVKLQGVPGLNRVRVQFEESKETTDVPKGSIDCLVERRDLERHPFVEPPSEKLPEPAISSRDAVEPSADRKREKKEGDSHKPSKKHKKTRNRSPPRSSMTWVQPNIRVRIISKRYGKAYYKEKAVVVDVTPEGATLQLKSAVLDQVAEIHLETALPKAGGPCVVVGSTRNKNVKGRLLDRNSRTAVMQESENGTVLEIDLDDIAEWCGSLDD